MHTIEALGTQLTFRPQIGLDVIHASHLHRALILGITQSDNLENLSDALWFEVMFITNIILQAKGDPVPSRYASQADLMRFHQLLSDAPLEDIVAIRDALATVNNPNALAEDDKKK